VENAIRLAVIGRKNYFFAGSAIIDQFSLGLRIEASATASISTSGPNTSSLAISGSYLATGNHYFTSILFPPFIEAGLGIFNTASVQDTSNSITTRFHFGGMPRAGFDINHFWMDVEYKLIPNNQLRNVKNSYLGIKLGVYFGGGKLD